MAEQRVLHVTTGLNVGGAEIMLWRYLKALGQRAENHAVVSLLPPGPIGDRIRALNVRVIHAGFSQPGPTLASLVEGGQAIVTGRQVISATAPGVVHGWMYHGSLAASLMALGVARRNRPRVVWGVHHSLADPRLESRTTRSIIKLSSTLSPLTAAIAYCSMTSALQHEKAGYARSKRVVIPNAIDTDEFRPRPEARRWLAELCRCPQSRIRIGCICRAHPMKNCAALVEAIGELLAEGHDLQLIFVGDGQPDRQTEDAIRELGIADRVTIFRVRDDIPDLAAGLDLFVLSSAWGEAFPLAAGEAMASGVPALVTDLGDCARLVGDPSLVVPPLDIPALIGAIRRHLARSPLVRQSIGQAARRRIEQNFSMARYVSAHEILYQIGETADVAELT